MLERARRTLATAPLNVVILPNQARECFVLVSICSNFVKYTAPKRAPSRRRQTDFVKPNTALGKKINSGAETICSSPLFI